METRIRLHDNGPGLPNLSAASINPSAARQGPKEAIDADNDSDGQRRLVERARNDMDAVMSVPRVIHLRNLSIGTYDPEIGVVIVTVPRGNALKSSGMRDRLLKADILFPEEALYLIDKGLLEVYYKGEDLLSFEEASSLFLDDSEFGWPHYNTLAFLRRLGYIVRRTARRQAYAKRNHSFMDSASTDMNSLHGSKRRRSSTTNASTTASMAVDPLPMMSSDPQLTSAESEAMQPSTSATPAAEDSWSLASGFLSLPFLSRLKQSLAAGFRRLIRPLEGYVPPAWVHLNQPSSTEDNTMGPLIAEQDKASIPSIFDKIDIIDACPRQKLACLPTCNPLELHLDVFRPDANFRKTDPGPPDFVVTVACAEDPMPDLRQLQALERKAEPSSLKFALDHGGTLTFFSLLDMGLPVYRPIEKAMSKRQKKRRQWKSQKDRHRSERRRDQGTSAAPEQSSPLTAAGLADKYDGSENPPKRPRLDPQRP